MEVGIEISMYALKEDYEASVIAFIDALKNSNFTVKTNGMSTQIFGDYKGVMNHVNNCISGVYKSETKVIFNLKIINNPLPPDFKL